MSARRWACERGQSAVETVAMLPLLVVVALAIGHALAAGMAHELAGHGAEAGAIAVLRGADAKEAVVAAVPGWAETRISVRERDGHVRVRLEPPAVIPGISGVLAATASADVGTRSVPAPPPPEFSTPEFESDTRAPDR